MKLDMHIHTTASDGQHTPSEVVMMAKEIGLEKMSITDHDTVLGIKEGRQQAAVSQIAFIPGIEISTHLDEEIHILGYFIDEDNEELRAACQSYLEGRLNRGNRIADYLRTKGIEVDLDVVKSYAGSGSLGRPHFARFLKERGAVTSVKVAFDRYLETPEFHAYVNWKRPTPQDAIALIHGAGGKAVLAHPGLLKMNQDRQKLLIQDLVGAGLDGLEAYYDLHTGKQIRFYLSEADKYGLKISCGSDFHGKLVKPKVKMGMSFPDEKRSLLITEER